MLIAEVVIPQMFTAYAEDLEYTNGLHHYQYFCKQCDQVFASAWGRIPGSMNGCERGSHFYCPNCGVHHHDNVVYINRNEATPNKMRLTVKEYKDVITFEVFSNTLEFSHYLRLIEGSRREIFRFDIVKQTVLFSTYKNGAKMETMEIGNPFDLAVLGESILRFFMPNSLANSKQKLALNEILKVLRETVHRRLEWHLGHKVSSMFVSSGQYHGTFLLPILNMAYRVACPDAPNLPAVYREETVNIRHFWARKMLKNYSMDGVLALTRQRKDFISAMIEAHELPNKPMVRRILREDPFVINMLVKSFSICQNFDNAISLYQGVSRLSGGPTGDYEELFNFLPLMRPIYGESGIVNLVEKAREYQIWDCMRLYRQLNNENKKALKNEKVRLRDLHDWMSLRHKRQNHVNLKFDVPGHIIKRLSMQTNRLKFFLPKESVELLEAGHKLRNCVASYSTDMKNNRRWIVLVADDKGKLVACLEIKEKELVQAKDDRNKPVSGKVELNNEIVAWTREANIKINTQDVELPSKKKARIRIPA